MSVSQSLLAEYTASQTNMGRVQRGHDQRCAERAVLQQQIVDLRSEKAKNEQILDRVPVAQALLQRLYDDAAGKTILACEEAMTNAVQSVIGDDSKIGIDAKISNNQIAVTVGTVVQVNEGERILRDIIDSEGGGLMNVICTILRLIPIVRTNQRKFIVLDESNCFLNPDQIPAHLAVINDLAKRAGFQIIMLTHHGVRQLADDPTTNLITLTPREGNGTATLKSTHPADTTTPGILSQIELINFGGHAHLTVPLIAGLNVITGPSNAGKSRIMAALRAVIAGTGNPGHIRTSKTDDGHTVMQKSATVKITFDGGKVLEWTRKRTGSPRETWSLSVPGMEGPPSIRGVVCSGRGEWVNFPEVMNIRSIGGLWPSIHTQLTPIFGLDNPKAMSALLSVSKTAVHLDAMNRSVAETKRDAMAKIRLYETQLTDISRRLHTVESHLGSITENIEHAGKLETAISLQQSSRSFANETIDRYTSLRLDAKRGQVATSVIANTAAPSLPDIDGMFSILSRVNPLSTHIWANNYAQWALAPVLEITPPVIPDTNHAATLYAKHARFVQTIAIARKAKSIVIEDQNIPDTSAMTALIEQYDALAMAHWAASNATAIISTMDAAKIAPDSPTAEAVTAMKGIIQRQAALAVRAEAAGHAKAIMDRTAPSASLPTEQANLDAARAMAKAAQAARQTDTAAELAACIAAIAEADAQTQAIAKEMGACPTCGHIKGLGDHSH